MTNYNWDMRSDVGGYLGQENIPVSTDIFGHQDEFGFKEEDDDKRRDETSQDSPGRLTDDGAADRGVGGSKSRASSEDAGGSDRPSHVQVPFGLVGRTGSNQTGRSDRHMGETDTSSKAAFDPCASDQTTGGDGWRPEDLIHMQPQPGSKKHELMNKVKEKLPGHHDPDMGATTDPKGAPKKGVMQKIKEKLPGQHGNDAGM